MNRFPASNLTPPTGIEGFTEWIEDRFSSLSWMENSLRFLSPLSVQQPTEEMVCISGDDENPTRCTSQMVPSMRYSTSISISVSRFVGTETSTLLTSITNALETRIDHQIANDAIRLIRWLSPNVTEPSMSLAYSGTTVCPPGLFHTFVDRGMNIEIWACDLIPEGEAYQIPISPRSGIISVDNITVRHRADTSMMQAVWDVDMDIRMGIYVGCGVRRIL